MPVPTLVTDLSTTLASNSPAGSDNVFPDLDNYLRAMSGFIASIRDNSGNGWVSPYLPLTYSAGTANGVVYLNGSKVVTTGSALVFDGTNLGIGTSSPSGKVDAVSNAYAAFTARASASGAGQTVDALKAVDSAAANFANAKYSATAHIWNYAGVTEGMRLDASGNLGLGVTPSAWGTGSSVKAVQLPGASLWGFASTNAYLSANAYYNGTNRVYVTNSFASEYSQASGVHAWFTAPSGTAGNAITFTQAMTLDASGNLSLQDGKQYFWGTGRTAIQGTSASDTMQFFTASLERARITSGGDLLVGTLTVSGAGGLTYLNQGSTGFASINNNNAGATGYVFSSYRRSSTEIGSITQNGTTAVLFNTTSDRRLKDNIVPAPSASDVIDAIEIVSHDWKAAPDEHVTYGVIAQDLHAVAPQAVLQGDDGDEIGKTWGVDYSKLVPMLIKEIQSLRARVAALEAA